MAVTSVAVRTVTTVVHCHWLLGTIGHRPLGHVRRWRHPPVYRPLVDLSPMEERHVIITYRLDRATVQKLCTQLEPDLMSAIRHLTGIPPQVQVLTRAEERYNEAHGRPRRVIERTFSLLKAKFRCLHMTGGSLFYSPKKVCQIIVACCMVHNLALRQHVLFLQEDGPDGGVVAAVEPVDSEDEDAEEEDMNNRDSVIQQYFQ
ncbi:hypothetical protein NDU88_006123 [Pleurodeles waltl]|uniref:DDE Tnp4 domain-containing protein n=1 Tax=Pleurodeles waltl TaxID=8319 RepID=A0AAV7UM30_PLEWA|nr:hypothetical protein NDU88_006123 [Pleurodeles waltl]